MTQQNRSKILNIGIIISIIAIVIGLVIYCLFSPNDNLFCILTATSNNQVKANIIVSEYVEKNSTKTFVSSPKPDNSLWTGLVNKPAITTQEKQSAKPIMIDSNNAYYAYHIIIKNQDKQTISYNIDITNLNQEQFDIVYGMWDKSGFITNQTLKNGNIDTTKQIECFVIITSKTSAPIRQSKKININITTNISK